MKTLIIVTLLLAACASNTCPKPQTPAQKNEEDKCARACEVDEDCIRACWKKYGSTP